MDVDGPVSSGPFPSASLTLQQYSQHRSSNFGFGDGTRIRPISSRGVSKRGRPRGSRRGGPIGGKARGMLVLQPGAKTNSTGVGGFTTPANPAGMSPLCGLKVVSPAKGSCPMRAHVRCLPCVYVYRGEIEALLFVSRTIPERARIYKLGFAIG